MNRVWGRSALAALCTITVAVAVTVTGCHRGSGSDIGPKLQPGPTYDYRVLVHDDSGVPVVGAKVTVAGIGSAVTARTGRAFLLRRPEGTRLITIDGSNGAAASSSRLGTYTITATTPDGDELPFVAYLPDHGPSVGLAVTAGVQGAAVTLDDSAQSGAILTIPKDENVSRGADTAVELRTGKLSIGHLPRALPTGGAAPLASRAIYIHPVDVQFQNGISLSVPNEIGLAAAEVVDVFRLDPSTGDWARVGTATESGGRITASAPNASIRSGGLYAFGKAATAATVVFGQVIDADKFPVPGVLVRGPQASVRTDNAGRFTLPAIAQVAAARVVTIECHGGRHRLPIQTTKEVTLSAASVPAGQIELDTPFATNLRTLFINRGAPISSRRFRISARRELSDASAVSDGRGFASFEEVATDVTGFLSSIPRDILAMFRTRNLIVLGSGIDNATNVFAFEIPWRWAPVRGTLIEAVDEHGTGALSEAQVVIGDIPGKGWVGPTDFSGFKNVGVLPTDSLTSIIRTVANGQAVTSAFTAEEPDIGRIETPLVRARRPFGAFGRFGVFGGDLTGVAASTTKNRRVRATGTMTTQDFYDRLVFGLSYRGAPVFVAPTATSTAYRVGVPAGNGHIAAAEGSLVGGVFQLERFGVALDVNPVEGFETRRDIALAPLPVGSVFRITGGARNLDASFATTDLRYQVAGEVTPGLFAELVGDAGIDASKVVGDDVDLPLPPLPKGIRKYLAVFGGVKVAGGVTSQQGVVAELDGVTVPEVPQLALPDVTSPTPGEVLPDNQRFDVEFTLPPECHYGVVHIRSTNSAGDDVRDWRVVVPRTRTEANFFAFQKEVPKVLDDSEDRTWTLTVSAVRIDKGSLIDPALDYRRTYVRILANWAGTKEHDRGARAFSSVSRTFQTKK